MYLYLKCLVVWLFTVLQSVSFLYFNLWTAYNKLNTSWHYRTKTTYSILMSSWNNFFTSTQVLGMDRPFYLHCHSLFKTAGWKHSLALTFVSECFIIKHIIFVAIYIQVCPYRHIDFGNFRKIVFVLNADVSMQTCSQQQCKIAHV